MKYRTSAGWRTALASTSTKTVIAAAALITVGSAATAGVVLLGSHAMIQSQPPGAPSPGYLAAPSGAGGLVVVPSTPTAGQAGPGRAPSPPSTPSPASPSTPGPSVLAIEPSPPLQPTSQPGTGQPTTQQGTEQIGLTPSPPQESSPPTGTPSPTPHVKNTPSPRAPRIPAAPAVIPQPAPHPDDQACHWPHGRHHPRGHCPRPHRGWTIADLVRSFGQNPWFIVDENHGGRGHSGHGGHGRSIDD